MVRLDGCFVRCKQCVGKGVVSILYFLGAFFLLATRKAKDSGRSRLVLP